MAIKTFTAVSGQSVYDICLNCYGTLDLLYKLLKDSGIDSVNIIPYSGQKFTYDDSLVIDINVFQTTTLSGKRYATNFSNYGSTFYTVEQNPNGNTNPNKNPVNPDNPVNPIEMYESVKQAQYTAGSDGETTISIVDVEGNPLNGKRVISIEKEIKPLKTTEWFFNTNTSVLTLLGGVTVDAGQTLYILYSETITTT